MDVRAQTASQPIRPSEADAAAFFTWRSVLLGAVMCLMIGAVGPYWTFYLNTTPQFMDYSAPGVMFLFFLLVVFFNVLLRAVSARLALKSGELVVVAAMMLVGGAVTTMGLVGYLVPNIPAPYYFANPSNRWATKLLPHLAGWMSPLDNGGGAEAIEKFYLGLRAGEAIPWRPWLKPLLSWAVFLAALYLCMMSVMNLVRKQWVDYERLSFPIAQVPQALCASAAGPGGGSSIFRSALFWAGFVIPCLVGSMKGLHHYYPWVPVIRTGWSAGDVFGSFGVMIYLSFAVLGFVFLIPNRVAFSLWSLNIISLCVRYYLHKHGLRMQEQLSIYGAGRFPRMAHMGMGAMVVFVAAGLWAWRGHLKRMLRCALGAGDESYDENEPCSYRTSLILLVGSSTVMIVWLCKSGLSVSYSVLFIASAMLIFFGTTRIVAQCGIPVTIAPMIAPSFVTSSVGAANIPGRGIASLSMGWTWCSDIRTTVMSSAAHGMYLARRRGRRLLWAMMFGVVITGTTAALLTVYLGYRNGAANLQKWFFIDGPRLPFEWAVHEIEFGGGPNLEGYLWTGVGALIMSLLVLAHRALFWWPIHPVGFLICSVMWTDYLWFTIFLAWLIKLIVVRVGGNRMFRMACRFFLGMILGQFSTNGIWAIVASITGRFGLGIWWI